MIEIKTDFDKKVKKMKPMHGVGQPPFYGINNSMDEARRQLPQNHRSLRRAGK